MKRMKRHKVKKEKPDSSAYEKVLQEHDLAFYIHDRVELMHQVFSVIKAKDLSSMAPECVRRVSVDDLQELCTEELLGISSKRLCAILDGAEPPSDTESSSRSRSSSPPVETISLDSISSDDDMLSQGTRSRKKKRRNSKSKPKKDRTKTKSKNVEPEGPGPPLELTDQSRASRAGLTVLELLELQARARAIRAQLQQEQARKASEPVAAASAVADDDEDQDVEIKEEQPEVVEILSSDDEKPDVEQLDKANAATSKQAEPTVNGTALTATGQTNDSATDKRANNVEKKKKDKGKKKKKDKKGNEDIENTAEVNSTCANKEVVATSNEVNKETVATITSNDDVVVIESGSIPQTNSRTDKVTKRVNDLIITVPKQVSRKIKLNRSKMTVSVPNTENDSSHRSVMAVTDDVPRTQEVKVSSVVTIPPERLSSVVNKCDVRTKLNEIRQRKNTLDKDKSIEKEANNTITSQDKADKQADINEKDKNRDKPKKAKKRVKRKSTTDNDDHDEITLQLSDSEKMDLLEDLDRKQYEQVSSTEESSSSSDTESDSANDTVKNYNKETDDTDKPTSLAFANKTDMIKDGTIAIEVINVNSFYAGIEEFDKEKEIAEKSDENSQKSEEQTGNTREETVHVDENAGNQLDKDVDVNFKTQDDVNEEIDDNLKTQDNDDESEDSAESSTDSGSETSQSSNESEHETPATCVNELNMPENDELLHQDTNNEKIEAVSELNNVIANQFEKTDLSENAQQRNDEENFPGKTVINPEENQNGSATSVTTEKLGYISLDKESEANDIEITNIFVIPVINDEATCANENDICNDDSRVQNDVAEATEEIKAMDIIDDTEIDRQAKENTGSINVVEQNINVQITEKNIDITEDANQLSNEMSIVDTNKSGDINNQVTEVMNEAKNNETIERDASSENEIEKVSENTQVSVEVSDKAEVSEKNAEKEKERELSEGEVSTAESSEVEAMEWKPEVVCISDEDDKQPTVGKEKKKKKEKKQKKDKKKSKKSKDFCESADQNFYTEEKKLNNEINAVLDEIIDENGDLIKQIDKERMEHVDSPETKVLDTISLGSNDDVYEILELSDDSSCYEVEGTVLSKEPTADEIAALSAKIDEIERDDIITDEQIEEHERMLREKEKSERDEGKLDENQSEKAKQNKPEEEEIPVNVSWKDRYLGSKKVKKVLTTSNILNALRKKNKELKNKLEQSKIKEAEEHKIQEEKSIEIPVVEEKPLEEGSIEHYNTLQGSTRYVDPVPDPEKLKKAEKEKKTLEESQETEGTQELLKETEQNAEERIKNAEIKVTGEMKKDAKQLLKIYKRLLKYNDITKQKDPNKVKKKKKKSKKKDGGNAAGGEKA